MGDWIQNVQQGFGQGVEFVKESWQELQKVYWPTRKETYMATIVVIIVVILVSLYLATVDFFLTKAVEALIG